MLWFEALHPPEVDGVADAQVDGIAPAAAQPDATPEGVEQSTERPEPVGGVPPGPSADASDWLKRLLGRTTDADRAGGNLASAEADPAPALRGCARPRD